MTIIETPRLMDTTKLERDPRGVIPGYVLPPSPPTVQCQLWGRHVDGEREEWLWQGLCEITGGGYIPVDPLVLTGEVLPATLRWKRLPR